MVRIPSISVGGVARFGVLALLLAAAGCSASPPRDYHFSPMGDDAAGDGSIAHPWQSIDKANGLPLHPGDRLLFEAGGKFTGNLRLEREAAGTPKQPVTIGSYGAGRATIDAGGEIGVSIHNAGNVTVRDLIIFGGGRFQNSGAGVAFFNDFPNSLRLENIRVENVDVSGFQFEGILIRGMASDGSRSGFRHVRIVGCKSHDNLHTGIYLTGWWKPGATDYANEDVLIQYCDASNNTGDPAAPWENRSGSGILVEAVNGAVVEHCLASNNGTLCNGQNGGPVGIWASIAAHVTLRCNKSINNHTRGRFDGGGFCLDGGVVDSLIQYNWSGNNDGSGYGVFSFEGAPVTARDVIRDNVSLNDGRQNGYAGVHLWNGGQGVSDIEIAGNQITMSPAEGQTPRAIWIQAGAANVRVHDNIITARGAGVKAVDATAGQRSIRFSHNEYRCDAATPPIVWGGRSWLIGPDWEKAALDP